MPQSSRRSTLPGELEKQAYRCYLLQVDARRNLLWLAFVLWLGTTPYLLPAAANNQSKSIRLRNETIVTPPKAHAPDARFGQQDPSLKSGLFLVQFTEALQPAWKATLEGLGVQLVCYVPENAFVVRLNQTSFEDISALEFVRWIGTYEPRYKMEARLARRMTNPKPSRPFRPVEDQVEISVVLMANPQPAELQQARACFRRLQQESKNRFNRILRGSVPVQQLILLSKSPAVLWIEPMGHIKLFDEVSSKIVAGDAGPGQSLMQSLGYDGSGVTVAVADSGLNNGNAETMHPDLFGRVDAFFHYGKLSNASDEHAHGTHVTGIIAGNGAVGETDDSGALYGLGVAPGAHIVAQRIFDGEGGFQAPATFELLTRDAVQAGAQIGSNSWGDDTQGRYDSFAAEFDALVRDADAMTAGDQPYMLEFSSGNAGPGAQSVGSPAVAKNVIATGASQNNRFDQLIYADGQEAMADFSSRGPAEDGRIKPDLVAPGTWIASAQSASASSANAWLPISDNYQYQGGTSQAGPHVSGAAAIFVQYYRTNYGGSTPSPALVKAALINSAVDMDDSYGTEPTPNNDEGWGRLDLTELIGSSQEFQLVDQTELLTVDQVYERQVVIDNAREPLKITLAYTDVPGSPAALPALVNDLDLEVIAPDGQLYRGNQFDAGESVPGGLTGDNINNVEGVHFAASQPGVYLVRVRARNVAQDARIDTPATDQDFALVIAGRFLPPSASLIFFDRRFYTAPDRLFVSVLDFAAGGSGTVGVTVHSDTEPTGEALVLNESSIPGLFTNSIESVTGAPATDDRLQVSHNDLVRGFYTELPAGPLRQSDAQIDLVPPVSNEPVITDQFGRTQVSWQTDEPAKGVVYFGTTTDLDRSEAVRGFTTDHSVELPGLESGLDYFFILVITDRAGNVSTNNNDGNLFSFMAPFAPDVLVVDAFFDDFLLEAPPIENYTDALAANGVSYDVWEILHDGSPAAADLRPFRVVMWRLPVFSLSRPTFTPLEQDAIREYLQGGGSFFLADMDVLTRLEETGAESFMREVLHVESFETDTTVEFLEGVENDPITDGMFIELSYYENYFGFDISDNITPTGDATPILYDAYSGGYAGLSYPRPGISSPSRVVFLSFPFDTIPETGSPNRDEFMFSLLKFLSPGLNGEAVISLDRNAYTIPSQATVEVADSDLIGMGQVPVQVFSSTDATGQTLTLVESSRRGTFRGLIPLIAHTNMPSSGQLRVQENDLVQAEFLDASLSQVIRASARVETVPPVISGVTNRADYIDATVWWTTSEDSDALVQYSESKAFLDNRTAYNPNLSISHEVEITGLLPDRTYYYRVISRDEAGNGKPDDNGGNLYTFHTLLPLTPPWSDSLEGGGTAWVVIDDDFTQSSWTLGTPNNGTGTTAHSPVNAWASNINGDIIDTAGTQLISPAIDLSGASTATLRFWHNMKFGDLPLDINETAALLIITSRDNLSRPDDLRVIQDDTSGWEELTVDLTPFAGKAVFLVWNYALFSFQFGQHPGWLIDDVSVEITTLSGAVIVITNNLAQANWTLTGPSNQSGGGIETVLTNMPPGDYTVTFGGVPYYDPPIPLSGTATFGATTTLYGAYTFVDSNGNGISDTWELDHFGEVPESHPATVDTDNDGVDDLGEFVSGTNPNDANSKLAIAIPTVLPSGDISLEWDSTPGRLYRVQGTSDTETWVMISGWIPATDTVTSFLIPAPGPGAPFMFRVEVRP